MMEFKECLGCNQRKWAQSYLGRYFCEDCLAAQFKALLASMRGPEKAVVLPAPVPVLGLPRPKDENEEAPKAQRYEPIVSLLPTETSHTYHKGWLERCVDSLIMLFCLMGKSLWSNKKRRS